MRLTDPVRVYYGEWFSEGRISAIEEGHVVVDFLDWVQKYRTDEITVEWIMYARVLTAKPSSGVIVADYR